MNKTLLGILVGLVLLGAGLELLHPKIYLELKAALGNESARRELHKYVSITEDFDQWYEYANSLKPLRREDVPEMPEQEWNALQDIIRIGKESQDDVRQWREEKTSQGGVVAD